MSCVIFKEHPTACGKKIVEITLNAERALNALAYEMIELIAPALERYRNDDNIAAIILDSVGEKAFCAGGDVVSLYHALQEDSGVEFASRYFTNEYHLDYQIHTYPKPIIAWGAGIVMGGGLGLLSGCSHRIVTETTMIAMPEVTIGLYPDVGASWFLNRAPGRSGLFLGITGQRINAADAKFVGIADRLLDNDQKAQFMGELLSANWQNSEHSDDIINAILRPLEAQSDTKNQCSLVREHYDLIEQLTDVDNVAELMTNIKTLETEDKWLIRAQKAIAHGSPMSIAMIYRQFYAAKHYSLKEAFISELALSTQCCAIGEIAEGIRALLVDKDGQPNWQFKCVEDVTDEFLDQMFSSPWQVSPLAQM